MGVTSGFFNSKDGDRKYDAEQMSSIFDGLISDGVYSNKTAVTSLGNPINQCFRVTPNGGMSVLVGTGRAWFDHTWTLNDNELPLEVSASEQTLPRIDAVVIEVNTREETRSNTIKIVKGSPNSSPQRPVPAKLDGVYTHALAYIYVDKGVTEILAKDITYVVGTAETPYVGGLLQDGVDVEPFLTKWDEAVDAKIQELETAISQATSGAVVDGSVKTSSIEDGAVTIDKLAWNAVCIRWVGPVNASGESQGIIIRKNDWNSGAGLFPGYPYYAKLDASKLTPGTNITQLTSSNGADALTMYPEVVFHPDAVALGVLGPVCTVRRVNNSPETTFIGIYATSLPEEDIKIISVTLWR